MERQKVTILLSLLLVLVGVLSFVKLGTKYTDPESYQDIIKSIDRKSKDALRMTGVATVASAGVTILPDDVATPVAEKLADFTEYFLVALCVLLAEKYALPLVGFAVFEILIPLVCILAILWLLTKRGAMAGQLALRLAIFGLVLWLAIPVSIKASDLIYDTYQASIDATIYEAEHLTTDISAFSRDADATFVERATNLMNHLLEALAVTVATSCIIPILVLLFFIWVAKILLGVTLPNPLPPVKKKRLPDKKGEVPQLPEN